MQVASTLLDNGQAAVVAPLAVNHLHPRSAFIKHARKDVRFILGDEGVLSKDGVPVSVVVVNLAIGKSDFRWGGGRHDEGERLRIGLE